MVMNRKDIFPWMVVIMLVLLSGCFGSNNNNDSTEPTDPTPTPKTISFTPSGSPADNSVYLEQVSINNDEITLALKIKGGTNVFAAAPEIDFDGDKIKYVSVSEGSYLNQSGESTTFSQALESGSNGILLIGISRKSNASGVNGDGTLATIILKVLTTQTNTPVTLNSTNSLLKSPGGSITGTSWLGGTLSYN